MQSWTLQKISHTYSNSAVSEAQHFVSRQCVMTRDVWIFVNILSWLPRPLHSLLSDCNTINTLLTWEKWFFLLSSLFVSVLIHFLLPTSYIERQWDLILGLWVFGSQFIIFVCIHLFIFEAGCCCVAQAGHELSTHSPSRALGLQEHSRTKKLFLWSHFFLN